MASKEVPSPEPTSKPPTQEPASKPPPPPTQEPATPPAAADDDEGPHSLEESEGSREGDREVVPRQTKYVLAHGRTSVLPEQMGGEKKPKPPVKVPRLETPLILAADERGLMSAEHKDIDIDLDYSD